MELVFNILEQGNVHIHGVRLQQPKQIENAAILLLNIETDSKHCLLATYEEEAGSFTIYPPEAGEKTIVVVPTLAGWRVFMADFEAIKTEIRLALYR